MTPAVHARITLRVAELRVLGAMTAVQWGRTQPGAGSQYYGPPPARRPRPLMLLPPNKPHLHKIMLQCLIRRRA
jgi:hypothetical protein